MKELLFKKKVDQSLLKSGTTVPSEVQQRLFDGIGVQLPKGERVDIKILLEGKLYDAILAYVNLSKKYANREIMQICYAEKSPLCVALKNIFFVTDQIFTNHSEDENKPVISAEDEEKIEFYVSGPLQLEIKCFPKEKFIVSQAVDGPLRRAINKFLNGYVDVKQETFNGHPFGIFVRNEIPNVMYNTQLIDKSSYLITGSVGKGNWAMVPWICIFDRKITTSTTKGVYIVYLLSKDGNSLYLTFNQGCTDIKNNHSKKEAIQIMHERADEIRKQIDNRGFSQDNISLGSALTQLAELYQEGMIFNKEYKKGQVPSEQKLLDDLQRMMQVYKDYVNGSENPKEDKDWWPSLEEYNPNLSKEDWKKYILEIEMPDHPKPMKMLKAMMELGGEASCGMLANKYGGTFSAYVGYTMNLGKRVKKYFDLPACMDGNQERYFPFPFLGKQGTANEPKNYVYRIRKELQEALKEIDFSSINPYYERDEEKLTNKEILEHIKKYITSKGFVFDDGLLENYYLSLKSKPFTILAGTSGTGKTRLVRLFAEAIGATGENGRYKLVSVRPDWSDPSDLFGHVDLNGKFVPGVIIDFIHKAQNDTRAPYFLCLDEMNLARVEYYLSDILSIIETRECKNEIVETDPLVSKEYYGADKAAVDKYGIIRIPENLYIVGTVNMDETTFPFSRKVLDRANTIEFSTVDLHASFADRYKNIKPLDIDNSFMKAEYVFFQQCFEEKEFVEEICSELQDMNMILERTNAHVGYRVRDEIVFYMVNNKKNGLLNRNEAFDNEIMQKILPRIQGSSTAVKNMLCELFKHCAKNYEGYQTENDDISSKMFKVVKEPDCKYKKSAKKIAFMVRRFAEDGFTAYWL